MTISTNKTDGMLQATDHAAHHNELATAVNDMIAVVNAGGVPSPEDAAVGDALVKVSDVDNDVAWKKLREIPQPSGGDINDVVTKNGAGEFSYEWLPVGTQPVGWGAITKQWFVAGTSLPTDSGSYSDGTVFIIHN
jgi:hypothetical protein